MSFVETRKDPVTGEEITICGRQMTCEVCGYSWVYKGMAYNRTICPRCSKQVNIVQKPKRIHPNSPNLITFPNRKPILISDLHRIDDLSNQDKLHALSLFKERVLHMFDKVTV